MKTFKRLVCFVVSILMLLQISFIQVYAEGTALITIDGTTVYDNWTEKDVANAFGSPKLVTPSAFGGNVSTYYGDNYSKFLYIETDYDGKIVSYSSITPNYQTSNNSYGDPYPYGSQPLQGYYANKWDTNHSIFGGVYYNCQLAQFDAYRETWKSNQDKYLIGLQKHAFLMTSAIAKVYKNKDVNLQFNEELFEANKSLDEQGSSFEKYAASIGKSKYIGYFYDVSSFGIMNSYMPNPLMYAGAAINYSVPSSMTYGNFYFKFKDDNRYTTYTNLIDPLILQKDVKVEMTAEEAALLKNAREIYKQSTEDFNESASGGYFLTDYQYKNLPLTAGIMKPGILKATLEYINAIRAGAGLPLLTLSENLCEGAQAKAVLTQYISSIGISSSDPHNPAKPDGVDDDFYNLSMIGNGENLYHNSILGGDFVINSITNALIEGYGDVYRAGHRYNLLNPSWKEIGFGSCAGQGVHKMQGYQSNDVDMVAWPSKGVMLVDANGTPARWTALFYKDYTVTSNTSITIKNLNSGVSWECSKANGKLRVENDFEISYLDNGITYADGDIFQFTIKNLLKNGSPSEYTYRTVFANAIADDKISTFDDGTLKGNVSISGNSDGDAVKVTVYNGTKEIASDTVYGNGEKPYAINGLSKGIYTVKVTKNNVLIREFTVALMNKETTNNIDMKLIGGVTGVHVNLKTRELTKVNETFTISAQVIPSTALNQMVTFSSSDPNVATVDPNTGLVTAIAYGTATITATTADGSKTDTCVVTANIAHSHVLTHIPAKESTHTEKGNIEYWECNICHKYFSNSTGTNEITPSSVETETKPHTYGNWKSDETNHWKECDCGAKTNIEAHFFGDWKTSSSATESTTGLKYRICYICGYKETDTIPQLTPGTTPTPTPIPTSTPTPNPSTTENVEMYRLYNKNNGEHFYTANSNERDMLTKLGWQYEGLGWTAPSTGKEVYRMYNANAGDHHYTLNPDERDMLIHVGWKYEGVGWYSDVNETKPLYREYNPNAEAGSHNYTTNIDEHNMLVGVGWKPEGIAWYGL